MNVRLVFPFTCTANSFFLGGDGRLIHLWPRLSKKTHLSLTLAQSRPEFLRHVRGHGRHAAKENFRRFALTASSAPTSARSDVANSMMRATAVLKENEFS